MGNIRLYGSTSGYTELAPPAVAPDGVLTLPTGTGTLATQASVGLVKIVDQSFTAASSVSVNNCFTSAYENYRIILTSKSNVSSTQLFMRFRTSGTDNSASSYHSAHVGLQTNGSGINIVSAGGNTIPLHYVWNNFFGTTLDVNRPQVNDVTSVVGQSMGVNNADTAFAGYNFHSGHISAAQFDGFTLYVASNNLTGTIRVYGYQN